MRAETDGAEHDREDDEEGACAESDGAGHGTASRISDNVPPTREFPEDERASRPLATGSLKTIFTEPGRNPGTARSRLRCLGEVGDADHVSVR
jgi:hypothetical protein